MSDENTNPETDKKWFYQKNDERKGAISEQEIVDFLKMGEITYGTKVWKSGFPDWLSIENTELSKHLNNSVLPPPISKPSHQANSTSKSFHTQKILFIISCVVGILSFFLPWFSLGNSVYSMSINGFGSVSDESLFENASDLQNFVLPYVLLGLFIGLTVKTVIGDVTKPHKKYLSIVSGVLVIILLILHLMFLGESILIRNDIHFAMGIGFYLIVLVGLSFIIFPFVIKDTNLTVPNSDFAKLQRGNTSIPLPVSKPKVKFNFAFKNYHKHRLFFLISCVICLIAYLLFWFHWEEYISDNYARKEIAYILTYSIIGLFIGLIIKTVRGDITKAHKKSFLIVSGVLIIILILMRTYGDELGIYYSDDIKHYFYYSPYFYIILLVALSFIITPFVIKDTNLTVPNTDFAKLQRNNTSIPLTFSKTKFQFIFTFKNYHKQRLFFLISCVISLIVYLLFCFHYEEYVGYARIVTAQILTYSIIGLFIGLIIITVRGDISKAHKNGFLIVSGVLIIILMIMRTYGYELGINYWANTKYYFYNSPYLYIIILAALSFIITPFVIKATK